MAMGGLGSKVGYADTEVGSPTDVAGILKVKTPETVAQDVVVPAELGGDGHKGHLPGSDDSSECTFSKAYSSAGHTALAALRRQIKWWTVELPDGGKSKGPGYITKVVKGELDADAAITTDVTIQPSGAWTFVPAA
ncbi:MAG: hypothetical protein JXL80_17560 [Planctomycetes bacterium]|nr:hypothetical protein [Planctomycetota bacterium]